MVGILEAGTVTIKNRQTKNSACLLDDDDRRSLQTKPNNGTDIFKVRALFALYGSGIQHLVAFAHHVTLVDR